MDMEANLKDKEESEDTSIFVRMEGEKDEPKFEKPKDRKLCPMKMANPSEMGQRYCDRERCAWWVKRDNDCALISLVHEFRVFNDIFQKRR